jgi:predicted  nucleic acid-binding Zn-ribbon protein
MGNSDHGSDKITLFSIATLVGKLEERLDNLTKNSDNANSDINKEIESTREMLDGLRDQISSLTKLINSDESMLRLNKVESKVDEVSSKYHIVVTLRRDINNLDSKISSLESSVKDANTGVSRYSSIEDKLDEHIRDGKDAHRVFIEWKESADVILADVSSIKTTINTIGQIIKFLAIVLTMTVGIYKLIDIKQHNSDSNKQILELKNDLEQQKKIIHELSNN